MSDEATRSPLTATASAPHAASTGALPAQVGRYRVEAEIARGGMGVVLRVNDPDLGRTLAVKVLLDCHATDPAAARRFLDEARLCGQLQHPGVPPVHELGALPDGRPFFAMKLVKGDTLAGQLAVRAGPDDELPRFVQIFEQVCQAVAYAHSRGVLHRDLKPANIMVGAFGEVQVMDWGLAKVLGSRPEQPTTLSADASTLYSTRLGSPPEETAPGSVLGTPAFMSPEQARGQVDHLDERADVYALGAILCVILTGRPPHDGRDSREVIRRAAEGDLGELRERLKVYTADAELVQLCLSCLAFQPSERPRDAAAVARAVAAYRAGVEERLRQAEIARAQTEVMRREERKRRRVLLALAGAVLVFLTAAGFAGWWWQRDRDARLSQTRAEVSPALSRAEQLREEARATKGAGVAEGEKREALLRQAAAAVEQAESATASGLADEALRRQVAEARRGVDEEHAEAERQGRQARREAAFLAALDRAREQRAVVVEDQWDFRGASAAYAQAFVDYGHDVTEGPEAGAVDWLRSLPEAVRESALIALYDWWAYFREPEALKLRARLRTVIGQADGDPWRRRLRDAVDRGDAKQLRDLAKEAREKSLPPANCTLLAAQLRQKELLLEAIELLRAMRLAHPREFWNIYTLGYYLEELHPPDAYPSQAELEEAAGCFRTAIALRPDCPFALSSLGFILVLQGKRQEAIAALRKSVEIDPRHTFGYLQLGEAIMRAVSVRELKEAEAAFRKVIELSPDQAAGHADLAQCLLLMQKPKEARGAAETALKADPKSFFPHYVMGQVLMAEDKPDEAITSFEKALEIRPKYFPAYLKLSGALRYRNRPDEALAVLRKGMGISWNSPVALDPFARNLSQIDPDGAIVAYRRILELDPRNIQALVEGGVLLLKKHDTEGALALFRALCEVGPNGGGYYWIGKVALEKKDPEGAAAAFRRQLEISPKHSFAARELVKIELQRRHFTEARSIAQQYQEKGELQRCDQLLKIEGRLPDLLARKEKPADAAEALLLADFCHDIQERQAASARFYADAFALDPKCADDMVKQPRYTAGRYAVLAACGEGEDAPPEEAKRAELRALALGWLRGDLDALRKLLDTNTPPLSRSGKDADPRHVRTTMDIWRGNPDLKGVREEKSLSLLTEAEHHEWSQFWADVAQVREEAIKATK
jgi:serine/threonine-protein kinase